MRPISEYADVMTLYKFRRAVADGLFIDYDGVGFYANEDEEDETFYVRPSEIVKHQAPVWATHVAWYNR